MSLALFLSIFVTAYVLVIPAYVVLRIFHTFRLPAALELRIHYFALSLVVVLSFAQPLFPKAQVFQPTVKVFSAPVGEISKAVSGEFVNVGYGKQSAKVEAGKMTALGWFFGMMIFGFMAS